MSDVLVLAGMTLGYLVVVLIVVGARARRDLRGYVAEQLETLAEWVRP